MLEFDRLHGHPFRLAGTRVCALFGHELKNQRFLDLWDGTSRLPVSDLLDVVADEKTGVVASASGRTSEGWAQDVEVLLLPLAQRGDTHARMIGVLAPISAPFWLGAARLSALSLGGIRHLDPSLEAPPAARLVAGSHTAAVHGTFTVYEGGRR
jgi:hypothetical protein